MNNKYSEFQNLINYTFKDISLLTTALTHSSASNTNNYERLEYLGDSLLSFVVADYLYKTTNKKVGQMSVLRSQLVSTDALSKIVLDNGWDKLIILGQSIIATHTIAKNILADVFESIIAAIYLDSNFDNAKKFITNFVLKEVDNVVTVDFKTKLQEKLASINTNFKLKYVVLKSEGPSHNMIFTIGLYYNDKLINSCEGKSKKIAEQLCAKLFLEDISKNGLNS